MYQDLLDPIHQFLGCRTPQAWVDEAIKPENLEILLLDHLLCELKAAQSAMYLIRRYAVDKQSGDALLTWLQPFEDFAYRKQGNWQDLAQHNRLTKAIIPKAGTPFEQDLIDKMVLLIKEELHHFYQVLEMMQTFGVEYRNITSSRYAKGLISKVISHPPYTLVDKLIIGGFIEARSCERFATIAPFLPPQMNEFYVSLLRSEARHYQDYLTLAQSISPEPIDARVAFFRELEAELILTPDQDFKFHSGIPAF